MGIKRGLNYLWTKGVDVQNKFYSVSNFSTISASFCACDPFSVFCFPLQLSTLFSSFILFLQTHSLRRTSWFLLILRRFISWSVSFFNPKNNMWVWVFLIIICLCLSFYHNFSLFVRAESSSLDLFVSSLVFLFFSWKFEVGKKGKIVCLWKFD